MNSRSPKWAIINFSKTPYVLSMICYKRQESVSKSLRGVWILHFRRIKIYLIDYAIWFGIWHFITFSSSQINLSQIHRVGDGNEFYRSLCYNSILQLIAHSSTHFPTIKMQHISMSLICLTINIQIYFIYNYISLINLA